MTKTFLSVDIDFWNFVAGGWRSDNGVKAEMLDEYLAQLTIKAQKQNIPISAVMNHQQMLKRVNASAARKVINIDTHSDLADTAVRELNCGTWVSYIRWRQEGQYVWIHAGSWSEGDCNADYPIFHSSGVRPWSDWGSYTHQQVESAPKIDSVLKNCIEICVCSSPDYSAVPLIPVFKEWRKKFDIPYTKGLVNENYGRKAVPPYLQPKHLGRKNYGYL